MTEERIETLCKAIALAGFLFWLAQCYPDMCTWFARF